MTRDGFIKIRKRQGKLAEIQVVEPCSRCGTNVHHVVTRREPRDLYFVFDDGPLGKIHRCRQLGGSASAD